MKHVITSKIIIFHQKNCPWSLLYLTGLVKSGKKYWWNQYTSLYWSVGFSSSLLWCLKMVNTLVLAAFRKRLSLHLTLNVSYWPSSHNPAFLTAFPILGDGHFIFPTRWAKSFKWVPDSSFFLTPHIQSVRKSHLPLPSKCIWNLISIPLCYLPGSNYHLGPRLGPELPIKSLPPSPSAFAIL